MRPMLILPLLALGCHPWDHWPDHDTWIEGPLWDSDVVAASDGLYVTLPRAGALAHVDPNSGETSLVDLGGAFPLRVVLTPDEQTVLVTSSWQVCDDPSPKIKQVGDCPDDELRTAYAMDMVKDGAVTQELDVPPHLNALAFSDDGQFAVAYLDYDAYNGEELPGDGLVDLTAVAFLNLGTGDTAVLSVGFAANNVLFNADNSRALVLSKTGAVVVDTSSFTVLVEYPFTLDPDQQVDPLAAQITPDGRYALVSITGSSDLYKLDLEVYSIDILSLDGRPSDMLVDADTDRTLISYGSLAQVDIIEHDYFNISSFDLDETVTNILDGGDYALLYNSSSSSTHDIYRVDPLTGDVIEFVVTNPVSELLLTENGTYVVALLHPSYASGSGASGYANDRWGLGIVPMDFDPLNPPKATSLSMSAQPVGLAVTESSDSAYALLLLEGEDELRKVNLADPSQESVISLEAPPVGIGSLPDGRFYITHDATYGLITFLDPATDATTSVGGFGRLGLLTDDDLAERVED